MVHGTDGEALLRRYRRIRSRGANQSAVDAGDTAVAEVSQSSLQPTWIVQGAVCGEDQYILCGGGGYAGVDGTAVGERLGGYRQNPSTHFAGNVWGGIARSRIHDDDFGRDGLTLH